MGLFIWFHWNEKTIFGCQATELTAVQSYLSPCWSTHIPWRPPSLRRRIKVKRTLKIMVIVWLLPPGQWAYLLIMLCLTCQQVISTPDHPLYYNGRNAFISFFMFLFHFDKLVLFIRWVTLCVPTPYSNVLFLMLPHTGLQYSIWSLLSPDPSDGRLW